MFTHAEISPLLAEFRVWLKEAREARGLTLREARRLTGINVELLDNPNASSGGYFWYEADCSDLPSKADYEGIKRVFNPPAKFDILPYLTSWKGLTDIDTLRVPIEQAISLNDNGLRSKPIQLYLDLFAPTWPKDTPGTPRILILYGGSGNAAVAAGVLGYGVDICEIDPQRAALIERRYKGEVTRWGRMTSQLSLFKYGNRDGRDSNGSGHLVQVPLF